MLTPVDVVAACRARYRLFLSILAVAIIVAVLLIVFLPRKYEATVISVPAETTRTTSGLSGLLAAIPQATAIAGQLGVGGDRSGLIQEAVAIVKSRSLLYDFIQTESLLPVLFPDKWNEETKSWHVGDPSDIPTLSDGYELLVEEVITLNHELETGLIKLKVVWHSPVLAASWANQLIYRTNELLRQRAQSEAREKRRYLEAQVSETNLVGVKQSLFSLIEREIGLETLAVVRQDYAFRVIDPAVPPDPDDYDSPKPLALLAGFFLGGFLLSAGICALIESSRS